MFVFCSMGMLVKFMFIEVIIPQERWSYCCDKIQFPKTKLGQTPSPNSDMLFINLNINLCPKNEKVKHI